MKLEYQINLKSVNESNLFLRALWAEFRTKYGKCSWLFQPYKDGSNKFIHIGQMDIGILENSISVGVNYSKRGCISKIIFNNNLIKEVENDFKIIIKKAKQNLKKEKEFVLSIKFTSLHGVLANYKRNHFKIYQDTRKKNNIIEISILGFDFEDASTKAQGIINIILDVLSSGTNSVFIYSKNEDIVKNEKAEWNAQFMNDKEWIDGISSKNDNIVLQIEFLDFIEQIIRGAISQEEGFVLNSCSLFHSGRKIDAQVNDLLKPINTIKVSETEYAIQFENRSLLEKSNELNILNSEIANVLYISSLEALTNFFPNETKTCSECGQLVYSISKRVNQFVQNNLGPNVAKIIKNEYEKRSKFLHTGKLFSKNNYIGVSIPQLNPNSKSGCEKQSDSPNLNIREYVSFLIRKTIVNK